MCLWTLSVLKCKQVIQERSSRGTASFEDKYQSIFSFQMVAIVFIILQIFFAAHAVLTIGENITRIFPGLNWGIISHVTHLDQLYASENI